MWHAIWFYILSKPLTATWISTCFAQWMLEAGNSVTVLCAALATHEPYHYLFHWQGLSGSSVVGSSVNVNSVAVIRPVARSRAKAGQEMVPIPCVPSSAICHWAGVEQREESKSPLLLSPTQTIWSTEALCSFHVCQCPSSFFKARPLYRYSNLVINTIRLLNNNQSAIWKMWPCYWCLVVLHGRLWCSRCCAAFLHFHWVVWLWTKVVVI